jgi:hypothetical protein
VEINGAGDVLVARNFVEATIWGSKAVWPLQMTATFIEEDGAWRPSFSQAVTF